MATMDRKIYKDFSPTAGAMLKADLDDTFLSSLINTRH
jgi:hypothetical protein